LVTDVPISPRSGLTAWHQAHWCWCGQTHDLFETEDINDAIEEQIGACTHEWHEVTSTLTGHTRTVCARCGTAPA
jgi:hypothetical protein